MNAAEDALPAGYALTVARGLTLRRAALIALPAVLLWTYWYTLAGLWRDWQLDENYSVGQIVPLVAAFLVWRQRERLARCSVTTCWWGAAVILLAQALHAFGLIFIYESAERYSLVLTVAGLVLLIGGWRLTRELAWILCFLLLMVPLPGGVHNRISDPLQELATAGATATLELLGAAVVREGHVMVLNDTVRIAVAEACSGLRLLTAFVVVAAMAAFLVHRPRWQKAVILGSSVPIAIFCNLLRLVATALLCLHVDAEWAETFFHDFAGWVMMPTAIGLLAMELAVMPWLVKADSK